MKSLLLSLIVIAFCGCRQPAKTQVKATKATTTKRKQSANVENEYQKYYREDSLYSAQLLPEALAYAQTRIGSKGYEKSFRDSAATLKFGSLFSDGRKYLLIERTAHHFITNVDLFVVNGNTFKLVNHIRTELLSISYLGHEILDVNGDHKKDFLVYLYPSSGCCRRLVYWVYLHKQDFGFSTKYEFLNPTFSPAEKVIRGVSYGHPGEVPLYKYKWNGEKIDTIEFIYRADAIGTKFYKVNKRDHLNNTKLRKLLVNLPREYRKIESVEWFLMN